MDLVKTGIAISQTIKNVGRLREIVAVFAKNGFNEFLTRGITSKIPNFVLPQSKALSKEEVLTRKDADWGEIIGNKLRVSFEELGPVFIKFGQLLSTREEIFNKSFVDQMKILRSNVRPFSFEQAKKSIEKSLGKPINEIFMEIVEIPIGTASIGSVYRGKLLNGEAVVVKVRRPNILKQIENDVSVLLLLANQLERISEDIHALGIKRLVDDFTTSLQSETNFNIEGLNCKRLKENNKKHDPEEIIYIPKVYDEYTKEDLLVMELIEGIPFTNSELIESHKEEVYLRLENAVKIFVKNLLIDGFFHADLHGGNLFLQKNGKVALVDFGLMGSLGKKSRINFCALVYSILSYNYENLVYEFLDVAEYEKIPEIEVLISDVKTALSPYIGLTIAQTNFTQVFNSIISTLRKHNLYLPREWFIVFRALFTLDGVGRSINFDINLYAILENDINKILKESFNKDDLVEEGIWASRDLLSSVRMFPRHIKWFLREWSRKNYAFQIIHTGHEKAAEQLVCGLIFLGLSCIASVFFIAGVIMIKDSTISSFKEIPYICWIFWFISSLFWAKATKTIHFKNKT